MMLRYPDGAGAGTVCDALCYNTDLSATLLDLAGVQPRQPIDGVSLRPLLGGAGRLREYVTVAWGPLITVITDDWWYNASIWGEGPLLYAVRDDPCLEHNLAGERPALCKELLALAVQDAGGSVPEAFLTYHNKPGCTPYEDRSNPWREKGIIHY